MDNQVNIYEQLTQDSIDRAEANANAEWLKKTYEVICELAKNQRIFTTDHVWEALSKSQTSTHEPRALGSLMQRAVREGHIAATGAYRKSTRRECHSRPIPIYVSKEA